MIFPLLYITLIGLAIFSSCKCLLETFPILAKYHLLVLHSILTQSFLLLPLVFHNFEPFLRIYEPFAVIDWIKVHKNIKWVQFLNLSSLKPIPVDLFQQIKLVIRCINDVVVSQVSIVHFVILYQLFLNCLLNILYEINVNKLELPLKILN